jgi:membrane protease YdiL (CAAX protease family)
MPSSPPVAPAPGPPVVAADWYADPWSPEQHLRYWDGAQWTEFYALAPPRPKVRNAVPTLSSGAAITMLAVVLAASIALRVVIGPLADVLGPVPAIALGYTALFGAMGLTAVWTSHRFGTGSLRHDLGLRFQPIDLLWFFFGAFGLWIVQIIVVLLLDGVGVPFRSNTDAVSDPQTNPAAFAVLALAAVIGAPIFEEIAFRGVIQRSFRSTLPVWGAITLTSALFGLYHYIPEFGIENAGLVIALAVVGAGFGILAHVTGRLAPAMLAHAGLNSVTLTILWLSANSTV